MSYRSFFIRFKCALMQVDYWYCQELISFKTYCRMRNRLYKFHSNKLSI